MKKLVSGLILFLSIVVSTFAVPAYPGLVTIAQPDGSTINVYLRGDENFSFSMTEDGYLLALNEQGFYEYAQFTDDFSIIPLGVKASDVSNRTWKEKNFVKKLSTVVEMQGKLQSAAEYRVGQKRQLNMSRVAKYPTQGSPKSLVILVNFQNLKFLKETANEDFTAMLNQTGYSQNKATSSAREYFRESSFGQFDPEFVVVGPYDLPENYEYYGRNSVASGPDMRPDSMILQACRLAYEAGVDFKEFDTDSNQVLDNVFVYYAGHNEAEHGGEDKIWPHRGMISGRKLVGGLRVQGYACTSELKGSTGETQCGIGTFCHEFGHVLELPDFYVTDYSHNEPTPKSWDVMDNGSYNNQGRTPPTYSSYERFFCGWLTPEPIDAQLGFHRLEPLIASNKAYIFSATPHNLNGYQPNPAEFFMLENRQRTGIDSLGVPADGLLVTHIDYDWMYWMMGNNNPNGDPDHMRVQIVCASGTTVNPALNTFPGKDEVSTLYFTFHSKDIWQTPVMGIREDGDDITFIYGETSETPSISFSTLLNDFDTYFGTDQVKTLDVVFRNIEGDVKINFDQSVHYILQGIYENDSIGDETKNIVINVPSKEEYHFKTKVIFRPRKISYDEYYEDRLMVTSKEFVGELPIKGISRRPIQIVTPEAYPATEVTKTSFVANWSYDEHATGYYLSVYTKNDLESDEIEKFGLFGNGKPEGWKYNFNTTNKTYTSSAPLSLQFTSDADTLWTKVFYLPVKSISFWTRSLNAARGTIYVDGLIDSVWTNVLIQPFDNTTINKMFFADVATLGECYQFKVYVAFIEPTDRTALLFDDFKTIFPTTLSYLIRNEEVFENSKFVSGYNSKVKHYYTVRATDKESTDKEGKYENISNYSNEICVDNKKDSKKESLKVSLVNGCFVVNLTEVKSNYRIYIYTIDGCLVSEIDPIEKDVILPNLEPNIYIVKYSEIEKIRRNDSAVKISY